MFERHTAQGNWHRIERVSSDGRVLDYVEVGECRRCGRGVDRFFPGEYRLLEGSLVCSECAPTQLPPAQAGPELPAFLRSRAPAR